MKTISILGCGDFLHIQASWLQQSRDIRIGLLYDPDRTRAERFAARFGGRACESAEAIFEDPSTDIVGIFVPPWIRPDLFEKAAQAGKAVICTKPLAPNGVDAAAMKAAALTYNTFCGVIYNRTESPEVEAIKAILEGGEFGALALYRQDWIHAYPTWNRWAIDPEKNGGPFMDAMIHNLNIARYLMGRPVARTSFVSENLAHPELPCADTEAMTVHFEDNGLASLFITWASDLATYSTAGNDREHIDVCYMVTSEGWRLTLEKVDGRPYIKASRKGELRLLPVPPFEATHFDFFAQALEHGKPLPGRFASLEEAATDIDLICAGAAGHSGKASYR